MKDLDWITDGRSKGSTGIEVSSEYERGEGVNLDRVKDLLENNRSRVVHVKELEGPADFILKPGKLCRLTITLMVDDYYEHGDDDDGDILLDSPDQFNG